MGKGRVRRVQGAKAAKAVAAAAVPRRSSFDVAALPYDLREYLGTFLARKDAVKLIRVNRDFHEVFSRVVWRVLSSAEILFSKRTRLFIRPSAWQRYGHLVRLLIADCSVGDSINLGELVPNAMYLKLKFDDKYYRDINYQQFSTLRNLRAVKVLPNAEQQSLPHGFIEWLNNESQSGQVETVNMDVSSVIGQVIPSIMSKVHNLRRLRLTALYGLRDITKPNHWAQSSVGFTEIMIVGSQGDHCVSAHLGPLLGHQHGVCFPHLTSLSIPACCLHQATQEFAALIPANFPALTDFELSLYSRECNRNPGQILLHIFASDWSQLISLSFVGYFSLKELDFALSATPNVRKLTCGMNKTPLDLEVIQSLLPRLIDLDLQSSKIIYSQPKQSSVVTSRIRRVHVQATIVSIDLLRFIFTASPCLRKLSIRDCQIQEDVARYGVRQATKTPLINLEEASFVALVNKPLDEHMITLLPAFANAAKLYVQTSREQKEQIYAKYPHVTFAKCSDS